MLADILKAADTVFLSLSTFCYCFALCRRRDHQCTALIRKHKKSKKYGDGWLLGPRCARFWKQKIVTANKGLYINFILGSTKPYPVQIYSLL